MKAYRLIINYPSLFQEHKIGDIVYYNYITKNYVKAEAPHYSVSVYDVENYPDLWELIEEEKPKPLFITDFEITEWIDGNILSVKRKSDSVSFKIGNYIQEGCIINIIIKNSIVYLCVK